MKTFQQEWNERIPLSDEPNEQRSTPMQKEWTPLAGFVPCLSIQQPWTRLIVHGHKDIENRDQTTSYRGPLLIYARKRVDESSFGSDDRLLTDYWRSRYSDALVAGCAWMISPSQSSTWTGYRFAVRNGLQQWTFVLQR